MRQGILLASFLLMGATASAQSVMILGGYEADHASFTESQSTGTYFANPLQGWSAGVVAPVLSDLSFVGRVRAMYGESYASVNVGSTRPHLFTYEAGMRFTHGVTTQLSPFVEGMLGQTYGQVGVQGENSTQGPFRAPVGLIVGGGATAEAGVGAGLDVRLSRSFGFEGEARYEWSSVFSDTMNRLQIGASLVWWPTGK